MGMRSTHENKGILSNNPLFGEISEDDMRDLMALAIEKKLRLIKS